MRESITFLLRVDALIGKVLYLQTMPDAISYMLYATMTVQHDKLSSSHLESTNRNQQKKYCVQNQLQPWYFRPAFADAREKKYTAQNIKIESINIVTDKHRRVHEIEIPILKALNKTTHSLNSLAQIQSRRCQFRKIHRLQIYF